VYNTFGTSGASGKFLRGDAVVQMANVLLSKVKGTSQTLLDQLVAQGVVTRAWANDFIEFAR
jgi:hypothetical protein